MPRNENIIAGLDIGSHKICVAIGEIISDTQVDIIGIGVHPSDGLRSGVVINIENTVKNIRKAIAAAETMAGCPIYSVFASIAGQHVQSFNSYGVAPIKNREVTKEDIQRVYNNAQTVAIPRDREILHVIPMEYLVDNQGGIMDPPLGMNGVRLEAHCHIVTVSSPCAANIIKCASQTGSDVSYDVSGIVLTQLASAEAVLSNDEKNLGVALLDIGGGTTNLAIYADGSIKHTAELSIGGDMVTHTIAKKLHTPYPQAEIIKKFYGCAHPEMVPEKEIIEVPLIGGRKSQPIPAQAIATIIEPCVQNIFQMCLQVIKRSGCHESLGAGVVLTGGTPLMKGIVEVAEDIMGVPVRIGYPSGFGGITEMIYSPEYATAAGLIRFGVKTRTESGYQPKSGNILSRCWGNFKIFFQDII